MAVGCALLPLPIILLWFPILHFHQMPYAFLAAPSFLACWLIGRAVGDSALCVTSDVGIQVLGRGRRFLPWSEIQSMRVHRFGVTFVGSERVYISLLGCSKNTWRQLIALVAVKAGLAPVSRQPRLYLPRAVVGAVLPDQGDSGAHAALPPRYQSGSQDTTLVKSACLAGEPEDGG